MADQGLISLVCKYVHHQAKRPTIQCKNGQRIWADSSKKEKYKLLINIWKKSAALKIKEMQITTRYDF